MTWYNPFSWLKKKQKCDGPVKVHSVDDSLIKQVTQERWESEDMAVGKRNENGSKAVEHHPHLLENEERDE